MTTANIIYLHHWDYDKKERVEDGEVKVSNVARCMTAENFVSLFDDFLNYGGKQQHEGMFVGKSLARTHPSLQRQAVCFCLGLIQGISESTFVDARNETAIKTAKNIAEMLKNGDLPLGPYL